jgi:hypothetical protein
VKKTLDSLEAHQFQYDALYFDGYAAHPGFLQDFSPDHPVTRKLAIDNQIKCYKLVSERGVIPGAELARFWCIPDCTFFFFTDWSDDLLTSERGGDELIGEPIPLFQLVFHDCYAACFSGGGYGRYDWPEKRRPRLYELLFTAAPGYNWMLPYVEDDEFPGLGLRAGTPVPEWDAPEMENRVNWLRRWTSFYRAVAYSEMLSHQFLNSERTLQRVEFANGVKAEFDMKEGLCKVEGVSGFSGDWENPVSGPF